MTRHLFSRPVAGLTLSPLVFALVLAGCAKKTPDETQNPDAVAGDGTTTTDTTTDGEAPHPSKARGSTTTRSGGRNTKARQVTTKKPPRAPIVKPEPAGPNGLLATAVSFAADTLPEDFSGLGSPIETFEVPNLDIDDTDFTNGFPGSKKLKEKYAIQFKGSLNVTEAAEYDLCLHSDDGSQLLLEGKLVVDNNGIQEAATEACELVYLEPGEYALEVRYFQASGPMLTLHMAWAIGDGEKVIIPTEVLFKPGTGG